MPTFAYTARTPAGEVRKGEIDAPNLAQAQAALRRQQIIPTTVTQKKAGGLGAIKIPGFGPGSGPGTVIFNRQFATMIDAGLPSFSA